MADSALMNRIELRVAREKRKAAKIELENKWLDQSEDVIMARVLARTIAIAIVTLLIFWIGVAHVAGIMKDRVDQVQITQCEQFVTQAHMNADCSLGLIGKTKA